MNSHTVKFTTHIGKVNTLPVSGKAGDGFLLDGGDQGEIFLPGAQAPGDCAAGQKLDVFVYPENDGRLVATCTTANGQVGECALMKAVHVTRAGAFMNWGIEKDLLAPVSQQQTPMQENRSYVVYLLLDPQQRVIGSTKLHRYLEETTESMAAGDEVELMIAGKTDLGYKAIVNGTHLGLLFKSEVFQPLRAGDTTRAYIKKVRPDGKIGLTLQQQNKKSRTELTDRILAFLETHGGSSTLTDYSPPEAIYKQYGVSKGNYKKALGALYKRRLIRVTKDKVTLLPRTRPPG